MDTKLKFASQSKNSKYHLYRLLYYNNIVETAMNKICIDIFEGRWHENKEGEKDGK